jgi:hypothetical protein
MTSRDRTSPSTGTNFQQEINDIPASARDPRGIALWMLVILALSCGAAGVILYLDVVLRVWQ